MGEPNTVDYSDPTGGQQEQPQAIAPATPAAEPAVSPEISNNIQASMDTMTKVPDTHTFVDIPGAGAVGMPNNIKEHHNGLAKQIYDHIADDTKTVSTAFAKGFGAPSTPEEAAQITSGKGVDSHGMPSSPWDTGGADIAGFNPGVALFHLAENLGSGVQEAVKAGIQEVKEATQNIREGGSVKDNIGKAASGYVSALKAVNPSLAAADTAGEHIKKGEYKEALGSFAAGFAQLAELGAGVHTEVAGHVFVLPKSKLDLAAEAVHNYFNPLKKEAVPTKVTPTEVQAARAGKMNELRSQTEEADTGKYTKGNEPLFHGPYPEDIAKGEAPTVQTKPDMGLTPEGANFSNEEIARGARKERYYTLSKGGNVTAHMSQPDGASDLKGGVVVKTLPDGTAEVQRGDSSILEKYRDRLDAAVKPENDPMTIIKKAGLVGRYLVQGDSKSPIMIEHPDRLGKGNQLTLSQKEIISSKQVKANMESKLKQYDATKAKKTKDDIMKPAKSALSGK